jgi:NAD-dependent SIR2 family protein deacetylase
MQRAVDLADFQHLVDVLQDRRIVVLSGAGCSTESGIPDYRGPETRRRARNPIQYREFMSDTVTRTRYWARSAIGWPRFTAAQPNDGHRALARMEAAGRVQGIITQNVDRLHQAAGSRCVVELHGALGEVRCLDCEGIEARERFQTRIATLNPGWSAQDAEIAPDGDAEVAAGAAQAFRVPECAHCEGTLKPNVVFFGENVPRDRVDAAWALLDEAEALLVVGSSLAVYSGYRFVLKAAKEHIPVAIVNLGTTRGDHLAQVRLEGRLGEVLPPLADALASDRVA